MKRHIQLKTIISLLSLLFAFSGAAFGQELTGVLTGTVQDANGAGIKGATVTITDTAKKLVVRTLSTDDDGSFTATDLHVGLYDVTVESPNFKKHLENNVKLDVGQRRAMMVTLEVGNVEEVVTVEANPVAVELGTPTVSTVINGDQARELGAHRAGTQDRHARVARRHVPVSLRRPLRKRSLNRSATSSTARAPSGRYHCVNQLQADRMPMPARRTSKGRSEPSAIPASIASRQRAS